MKGKRDRAILATLLGCGLRRREHIALTFDHIQRREDHWAIVDLVGKGGHIRTVPMPDWVKQTIDDWLAIAQIAQGKIFRCVCRKGTVWGTEITEKVVWHVVKEYAARLRSFQARATRSQEVMRSILSRFGRRIGADPIPARSCVGADHREVPGLQAEVPTSCQ